MTKSHVIRESPRKSLRRIRNEETRKCLCRRLSPLGKVGGVDDTATFAVALEQRHECLHAMHHARQIDIDHPAPILRRNIVGGAGAVRTGFVAHDMYLAEGFDLGLYHALMAAQSRTSDTRRRRCAWPRIWALRRHRC
jgi:hypothetical protein